MNEEGHREVPFLFGAIRKAGDASSGGPLYGKYSILMTANSYVLQRTDLGVGDVYKSSIGGETFKLDQHFNGEK